MNFERPTVRTAIGFDTFDLAADLVVDPDLSRWLRKGPVALEGPGLP
ncbi:hypothetical protein [Streptomyces sp. NBC_00280]